MMNFLRLQLLMIAWMLCCSFVLIGGPMEAKLDVSQKNPEVTFIWNGDAPDLKNIITQSDQEFHDLSSEEITAGLILQAMDIWNQVPGAYIQLKLGDPNPKQDLNARDGVHAIVLQESDSALAAAYALPIMSKDGSTIADCDIALSPKTPASLDTLLSTITHELGHCLGLGHPHSDRTSIMSYGSIGSLTELTADDMAGLIYLYPTDGLSEDHFLNACGSLSSTATHHSHTPWWWALLMLLPFLLILLRRNPKTRQTL